MIVKHNLCGNRVTKTPFKHFFLEISGYKINGRNFNRGKKLKLHSLPYIIYNDRYNQHKLFIIRDYAK